MRKCKACQKPLTRKPDERTSNWSRRTVCGERCRLTVMCKRVRELDSQRIEVACVCGAKVMRSARFRHSEAVRCSDCTDSFRQANAAKKRERQRTEARRYRILIALSPYGTFEQLLAAIRVRQPRTRAQRYDLATERRTE